jgi:hypothetical protein
MEIFGGVASGITIAEVAVKLAKFASMLKKADEEFERYCASLSGLHQVRHEDLPFRFRFAATPS